MAAKIFRMVLRLLGFAVLLAVTIFILARWRTLPEQLPSPFNAAGEVDSYSGRGSLVMPLFLAWFLYGTLTALSFFPRTWNVPGNSPAALRAAGNMLAVLGLLLALCFAWITLCSALGRNLGLWFLPAMLISLFGTTLAGLVGALKK